HAALVPYTTLFRSACFRTEGGSPAWAARSQTISGAHMESMPKQDLLTRLRLDLRRHGRRRTAYVLAMKLINKLFLFRVLHALHLQRVNPAYLDCPEGFVCGFLGEAQLRRYARDPRNELDD